MLLEEFQRRGVGVACRIVRRRVSHQVFGLRDTRRQTEPVREPGRVADVIGVEMRDDDGGRPVAPLTQQLFPQRARGCIPDSAVDDHEVVPLSEQPQVDMVQRERKRHTQPPHAGSEQEELAGRRHGRKWILQCRGCGGHAATFAGIPAFRRKDVNDGPLSHRRSRGTRARL